MAEQKIAVEVLDLLNDIVDLAVGNIPADDIGVDQFSTLPEALSRIQLENGDRNAIQAALKYMEKLKEKVVFLDSSLKQVKFMQERGIIRS